MLNVRQVAERLKLHPNTIYKYIWAGILPAHKLGGNGSRRHWHIKEKDLETLLQGAEPEHAEANNKKPNQELVAGSAPTK